MMKTMLWISVAAALLAGCTSTSPVNNERYSLIMTLAPRAGAASYPVTVVMDGALAGPGVVIRMSDVALRPARNHLWDMAPGAQLERLLAAAFAEAGVAKTPVRVTVSRFDGTSDGVVTVEAVLTRAGEKPLMKEFCWQGRQPEAGYTSLVQTLREGANAMAADFARALQGAR